MNIKQRKQDAAQALFAAPNDPFKLTLLHTGLAAGASLLVSLVSYVLSLQIDSTGGLSGIGARSMLLSAQSVLSMVLMLLTPFWDMGYLRATLSFARKEETGFHTLLEGLRQWTKVLRLLLLRIVMYAALTFICLQATSIIFAFTPWSMPAMQTMEKLIAMGDGLTETIIMEEMLPVMIPVYIIFAITLCVVLIPAFYRLRLADLALMDGTPGARAAFRVSSLLSKGKRISLMLLDLSFWWYYLGLVLCVALSYGDVLLELAGVKLTGDVWAIGFSCLSVAAQVLFMWRFTPYVATTTAMAYEHLKAEHAPKDPPPAIENKWSV